jgi:hypothetical protein
MARVEEAKSERKMGDYSDWFSVSFARSNPALSLRSRGYRECLSDWTIWDCFWWPVVIRWLQGSESSFKNMIMIG